MGKWCSEGAKARRQIVSTCFCMSNFKTFPHKKFQSLLPFFKELRDVFAMISPYIWKMQKPMNGWTFWFKNVVYKIISSKR